MSTTIQSNEKQTPAQIAIAQIRERLGTSSVARRYNQLNQQQKSMVLYGAKLKPSSHINTSFEQFNNDQRDAIRTAIIAMNNVSQSFNALAMTREQFRQDCAVNDVNDSEDELSAATQVTAELISQFEITASNAPAINQPLKKVQ